VNLATHVDGQVQVSANACNSCHGSSTNAAPPAGTHGETSTTARAVGAHQAHVAGGTIGKAIGCAECHPVPTSMSHSNGTVEVAFGTLSRTGGAAPAWNGTSCASTYCHGATLNAGGTLTAPSWTVVNGSQDACGTCHRSPPPLPHVQNGACGGCHAGYTATTVDLATHIDGKVDVLPMTCSSCHGDGTRVALAGADSNVAAAPPTDSAGNTAVTARGVGAHLAHVNQATYRQAPLACADCHLGAVPPAGDTAHANGSVAFAFGALAKNASWGGVTPAPAWNRTTCAGTYCHGAFKNGATATMTWATDVTLTCASCHGAPPGGTHPANANCGGCHAGYTATSVNKATHMNGALDVSAMTCTSCHGAAGKTATASSPLYAAPPVDTAGASTSIRVGAHQKHLVGGTYSSGMACKTCHANVGTYTSSHTNGVRDVGFTGAANASLQKGTWTAGTGTAAGTCASTWCHGAVMSRAGGSSGGTMLTPSWTGSITACTPCHGAPPSTGRHTSVSSHQSQGCGACHTGYSSTAVNKTLHVNGTRDVGGTGTRITSWNATSHTCSSSCHGSQTW
jgi:predicted CxxxxCH...CXXCH cytochrome family protein